MKKFKELYLKYNKLILYIIFGFLATIVNLAVKYLLLFTILKATNPVELQISIIISWIAAVIFAYFTNRTIVFESQNKNKLKEFFKFVMARITTLLLEMFIMWFFITLLNLNTNMYVILFTIISQILVIVGNYIFSKIFVFKKESD